MGKERKQTGGKSGGLTDCRALRGRAWPVRSCYFLLPSLAPSFRPSTAGGEQLPRTASSFPAHPPGLHVLPGGKKALSFTFSALRAVLCSGPCGRLHPLGDSRFGLGHAPGCSDRHRKLAAEQHQHRHTVISTHGVATVSKTCRRLASPDFLRLTISARIQCRDRKI